MNYINEEWKYILIDSTDWMNDLKKIIQSIFFSNFLLTKVNLIGIFKYVPYAIVFSPRSSKNEII